MARFNLPAASAGLATNLAGGEAYAESPQLELVSTLVTSFLGDQFYRSGAAGAQRIVELVARNDPLFAAKAALYARTSFGMRTASHLVAGEVAHRVKGEAWTKAFYAAVVQRPDDALEIASYVLGTYGKPLPNSLKKGLALALGKFDAYQLAKYRAEGNAMKLVDLVNLVHPKPGDGNAATLKALVAGELRAEDTWEAKLTQAGQLAASADEAAALKREAWADLVASRRIGHFALLRNLRNILQLAPDIVPAALELLTDEAFIRGSRVLPFRYATAWRQMRAQPGAQAIVAALSRAAALSLSNVPRFDGATLVALDVSASMQGRPAEIGAVFAAALAGKGADLILFTDDAKYLSLGGNDIFGDVATIEANAVPGGTNFHAIFQTASRAYDRIIILSDMQGWMTSGPFTTPGNPREALPAYRRRTDADPKIFSFDLQGYGTLQFPEKNVYALAGFSDRAFEVMALLERGTSPLIAEVDGISF